MIQAFNIVCAVGVLVGIAIGKSTDVWLVSMFIFTAADLICARFERAIARAQQKPPSQ